MASYEQINVPKKQCNAVIWLGEHWFLVPHNIYIFFFYICFHIIIQQAIWSWARTQPLPILEALTQAKCSVGCGHTPNTEILACDAKV